MPHGERATFVQADLKSPAWKTTLEPPFDAVVSCIAIHSLFDAERIRTLYGEIFEITATGARRMHNFPLEFQRVSH